LANFEDASLLNANLQGAYLEGASLRNSYTEGANFQHTYLGGADLRAAILAQVDLSDSCLEYADLRNADLSGANLQRTCLDSANLEGVHLGKRSLLEMEFQPANLMNATLRYSNLRGSNLDNVNLAGADLRSTDLRDSSLVDTNLKNANLEGANLQNVYLSGTDLSAADLRGSQLQNLNLLNTILTNIYINGSSLDKTKLRWKQIGGMIGEEKAKNYEHAMHGYRELKQNFDDLGDYDAASRAYQSERRMEKLWGATKAQQLWKDGHYWQAILMKAKWASDWFVEILCGYGENLWRVILWLGLLLFVFGPLAVSLSGGLQWTGKNVETYYRLGDILSRQLYAYFQNLLYMLDTITTANFSELQPANDTVRLLSGLMAMIGIFLTGLLGFVAGNRIRNS
jgi:uncharacterized protein YjbI with pentapeptide repeats